MAAAALEVQCEFSRTVRPSANATRSLITNCRYPYDRDGWMRRTTPPYAEVFRRAPEPGEAAAVTRAGKCVFKPYTALAERHAQPPGDLTFQA